MNINWVGAKGNNTPIPMRDLIDRMVERARQERMSAKFAWPSSINAEADDIDPQDKEKFHRFLRKGFGGGGGDDDDQGPPPDVPRHLAPEDEDQPMEDVPAGPVGPVVPSQSPPAGPSGGIQPMEAEGKEDDTRSETSSVANKRTASEATEEEPSNRRALETIPKPDDEVSVHFNGFDNKVHRYRLIYGELPALLALLNYVNKNLIPKRIPTSEWKSHLELTFPGDLITWRIKHPVINITEDEQLRYEAFVQKWTLDETTKIWVLRE